MQVISSRPNIDAMQTTSVNPVKRHQLIAANMVTYQQRTSPCLGWHVTPSYIQCYVPVPSAISFICCEGLMAEDHLDRGIHIKCVVG